MREIVLVAIGGLLGATARFLAGRWLAGPLDGA